MKTIAIKEISKLEDLDNLYRTTISKLPAESRISYCNYQLINLQELFEKNNPEREPEWYECTTTVMMVMHLDPLKEMIHALKDEIKKLFKK